MFMMPFLMILSLALFAPNKVMAETEATVKIYAVIQDSIVGEEMEVDLINTQDKSKVYTFEVGPSDDWVVKVKVPEGEYKTNARVKGYGKFANKRASYSDFPKTVKATKNDKDAPIFTVVQGDWEFADKFQWLSDTGDFSGNYIRGPISMDKIKEISKENVAAQDKEFMNENGKNEDSSDITEEDMKKANEKAGDPLDSGFKEENMIAKENKEKAEKLEPLEEKKMSTKKIISLAAGAIIVVGLVAAVISKKK